MAYIYILHSEKLNKYYTGSCVDLEKRLKEHLSNKLEGFTGKAKDWKLIFSIDNLGYQQARNIETHIKKMKSKTYIHNLLKYPDIVNKLKMKYAQ